jgi:hypothetical protein
MNTSFWTFLDMLYFHDYLLCLGAWQVCFLALAAIKWVSSILRLVYLYFKCCTPTTLIICVWISWSTSCNWNTELSRTWSICTCLYLFKVIWYLEYHLFLTQHMPIMFFIIYHVCSWFTASLSITFASVVSSVVMSSRSLVLVNIWCQIFLY